MLERSPRTVSIVVANAVSALAAYTIAACCFAKVVVFHTVNLSFKGREGQQLAFGDRVQRLPLVAACCCFQASGHDINRLLAFLAGTRQLCAVAAPVLGQLVSGTLLWYARFRGLEARFPRPGVRLDAAPVNFGLLKPAGTKRCRKCRISTCWF